jgi:uncharacterized protein (TIGR03435 family)
MISELANHVWQSTLFAVAVGLLAMMCRRNHASVRYWLWFSASVKFFIPFAVLMTLGERLEWASRAPQVAAPAVSAAVAQVSRPFVVDPAMGLLSAPEVPRGIDWFVLVIVGVWVAGVIAMAVVRFRTWRQIRAAVGASSPWAVPGLPMPTGVTVRSTPGVMEPGVVGLWRPVLLVPSGIEDDLTPRQLAAVLTHELCHIRRRDNLTAAVHMIVEAVFWFHPLVWWIGSRLVDERERACDEEVVHTFGEPQTYAEGIVNVCRRYVDMPLACVSGVSGANVKNRIRDIMTNRAVANLSAAKKVVLAGAGTIAVVAPILAQSAPQSPSISIGDLPSFEVASIKQNRSGEFAGRFGYEPGGQLVVANNAVRNLIRSAYNLQNYQIVGGPDWMNSDRYDVSARAGGDPSQEQLRLMLRRLLIERFKLAARLETRDIPTYALVVARGDRSPGPGLRRAAVDCLAITAAAEKRGVAPQLPQPQGNRPACGTRSMPGSMMGAGVSMSDLARNLAGPANRMVVDKTALSGAWDFDLTFALEQPLPNIPGLTPPPADAVPLFTALQEQLGLKLEPQTAAVEVLVIDRIERPTPN